MIKRITLGFAVVGASLAFAVPAFSVGQNPDTSCGVGNAVSLSTQDVGGLGKFLHSIDVNPGQAIQDYHNSVVKPNC